MVGCMIRLVHDGIDVYRYLFGGAEFFACSKSISGHVTHCALVLSSRLVHK